MNLTPTAAPPKPRRRLGPKFAAALIVLLGTFLVCEIAARLVFPAPPDPTREPQIVYVTSDAVGYLHLPSQRGWIDDGFVTINALGFRGAEPLIPKPEGCTRFLVVGSSNTVGWGVHDDQTYCAALEKRLPETRKTPVEVLNWSVSGYKMEHKERLLAHYGLALKPDYLLIDFSDYDLFAPDDTPRARSILDEAKPSNEGPFRIPHTGQQFQLLPQPGWLNRALRKSRAIYCVKNGLYGLKVALSGHDGRAENEVALLEGRSLPAIDDAWNTVEASFERIHELTKGMKDRVAILIFPVREQVTKEYPHEQYQTRLKALAERHGFQVIDPLPRFRENAARVNELFIPYDRGHPGPLGHQLIAETILDAMATGGSASRR